MKMCLFYDGPTAHARSDPIISNECVSDHVHTFYGPQQFHPQTSYNDLISTDPTMSRSPFVENQSVSVSRSETSMIGSYIQNDDNKILTKHQNKTVVLASHNLSSQPKPRWIQDVYTCTSGHGEPILPLGQQRAFQN